MIEDCLAGCHGEPFLLAWKVVSVKCARRDAQPEAEWKFDLSKSPTAQQSPLPTPTPKSSCITGPMPSCMCSMNTGRRGNAQTITPVHMLKSSPESFCIARQVSTNVKLQRSSSQRRGPPVKQSGMPRLISNSVHSHPLEVHQNRNKHRTTWPTRGLCLWSLQKMISYERHSCCQILFC